VPLPRAWLPVTSVPVVLESLADDCLANGLSIFFTEVTERKQVQAALRRSEKRPVAELTAIFRHQVSTRIV